MGQIKTFEIKRSAYGKTEDSLERLVAENFELRQTAVELALQTSILRERLSGATTREQIRHKH